MKSSILASTMLVALCAAAKYCDNGVKAEGLTCGGKSLYCCIESDKAMGSFYNARKGCGKPSGGPIEVCGGIGDDYTGYTTCCNS
ncbi:hypothetical protein BUE80_DR000492 [Diplocarpon rosae]|nr:hypothetical protein BUE80_DR000492 [Diplocarpon rosae]